MHAQKGVLDGINQSALDITYILKHLLSKLIIIKKQV